MGGGGGEAPSMLEGGNHFEARVTQLSSEAKDRKLPADSFDSSDKPLQVSLHVPAAENFLDYILKRICEHVCLFVSF